MIIYKKRYQLGVMDLYPIVVNKTCMENSPFLKVKFLDKVNVERLYNAVKCALKNHPLFECTIDFIDICNEKGIHFEISSEYEYEQANLRMKKLH